MNTNQQSAFESLSRLTELGRIGREATSQCFYEAGGKDNGIQLFQMGVTDVDMRHFADLPEWHYITLRECPVSDAGLEHLANQKGLRFLDIAETEVTTLQPIRECVRLQQLWCDGLPEMTDRGASALANFRELWHLDLSDTDTGDATAERLATLTLLRKLNLTWTKITDAGLRAIGSLPNLETLSLYQTAVTDEGLSHLQGLSNLRLLAIGGTAITEKGRSALLRSCPDLKVEDYASIS